MVFAEVPPQVEYELPPMGHILIEPAVRLAAWAIEHNLDTGRSSRSCDSRDD